MTVWPGFLDFLNWRWRNLSLSPLSGSLQAAEVETLSAATAGNEDVSLMLQRRTYKAFFLLATVEESLSSCFTRSSSTCEYAVLSLIKQHMSKSIQI